MAVQFGTKLSLIIRVVPLCSEHSFESVLKLQCSPAYVVITCEAASSLLKLLQPWPYV